MLTKEPQQASLKGGEFLLRPTAAPGILTPADFTDEQRQVAQACQQFLEAQVLPHHDRIDQQEKGLMRHLLTEAGQLGLFGVGLPEQYGGLDMDFVTTLQVTESLGSGQSFAVAFGAHVGIGTLPILYFGTPAQQQRYLPRLATGELLGAYCLTEPGSGSDALGAKTKAVLNAEGTHYILNGQKMWITNAGFADVFIVFAKIDGEQFTGFIVDRTTPGLSFGPEEHKMGIKGSSTRQVFLTDAPVPVENVLGAIGQGHLIAFNVLNIGRIKLAAAAVGYNKSVATRCVHYANERVQFKLPISKFGAIRAKLAQQAIRTYALEAGLYRAGADISRMEQRLLASGLGHNEALLGAASEFAVECAILKVEGSEALDYVVDEGVQIFGGYGFSADYPMDRAYRDARINRIFEGTNEINRMLAVDMLLKKGLKGELDLMGAALALQQELLALPAPEAGTEGALLGAEHQVLANLKKATLLVAGAAVQKFTNSLAKEQEVLLNLADMLIGVYMAESTLLRVEKEAGAQAPEALALATDMARVYLYDTVDRLAQAGKEAISSLDLADAKLLLLGLKRFTKTELSNAKDARRRVAARLIEANAYCF